MSQRPFHLQVYTQTSKALDADVRSVVAPAVDGLVGILAGHAPYMTVLGEGDLKVDLVEDGEQRFFISGGFLEVHGNKATILTDSLTDSAK